ncbi:actin-like ATPase domain-containing protein [Mollisia scopiformis]|uniref:Actin-like ATPase domain-containing protein n=1 Tax=Mollisia scopiformis TaxID=149040 RepID=A0A194XN52_MOLSC|nr:actin-like ATPase domain-containing protein [Mollisia scopiformis]KUJ21598.1 actin-like ATPase domain-containing protein [Mollisia scopiformis]
MASRSPHRLLSSPLVAILCLFYLFSSTALAASAVLGVDLGTEYIKAALVKPGIPLEIVLTKDSRRKEASAVAFKPAKNIKSGDFPERLYGSDAIALSARFPGDVYPNLKRLLGLGVDNSVVVDYAARHPALKLEEDKTRGTAAFRSGAFTADEAPWTVEEILAMELQSIQKNAEALAGKGSSIKDLVITVPVFFSAEEKRAVELAAELAGLRVLELVSDGLAVGLNYATSRTFPSINEGGNPEYHMVFDMGAGSTKATILRFQGRTVKDVGKYNKTIQEVAVLGSGWDRTLGGDALNAIIVDDMIAKFVASPGAKSVGPTIEAVQGHGRAAAKLWKEAERLRHVLSANTNTQASFEGLYEDIDFKYKITREEFEQMTESYAARIGIAMQKALDMANLEANDIESLILHGGAMRTPFVQKELEKFIGNADKVRTNVNADEAAVFGAGFRGAGLSPSFRVKEIRASEGVTYPAGIKWINIHEKPQHIRLWNANSHLGSEKQYTFKNQEDPFAIKFYQHVASSEDVSKGSAEKDLITLTTQNLTDSVAHLKTKFGCTDGDINIKLSTRLAASNGEVEITKFILDCEVEAVEEKESMVDSVKGLFGFGKKDQIPLSEEEAESSTSTSESASSGTSTSTDGSASASTTPSTKDAKAKDAKSKSLKPTKRFEVVPLKYTVEKTGRPQLPASELTRMKERIAAFDDSDRSRKLREESLNQLEGFVYKVRDLLENEAFIAASTEKERAELETKSKAASDWIYSGGTDAPRDELKSKLKEMKDIVKPIEVRKEEAATRPEKLKALQDALNQTQQVIIGITEQIANDTKAHAEFSASKSAASTAKTTPAPSSTPDEFAGLEDDEATTTTTAPVEEATLDPPVYSEADLILPQSQYDTISKWLSEKLSEQEKLGPTDDPVMLSKDLEAKAKTLTDIHVELIMKSMRKPFKSSRPPPKPKSKPKKTSSKKKGKGSKTESVDPASMTMNYGQGGKPMFTLGPDGELPSEEEILAFVEQNKKDQAATEAKAKKEGKASGDDATTGESGDKKKHDEL